MAEDSAYAEQFCRAIEDIWSVRTRQGVRAGQHLDKLAELVGDIFVDEGFAEGNVLRRRQLELSGYYRSEKRWDLLVVYKNVLAAAIDSSPRWVRSARTSTTVWRRLSGAPRTFGQPIVKVGLAS